VFTGSRRGSETDVQDGRDDGSRLTFVAAVFVTLGSLTEVTRLALSGAHLGSVELLTGFHLAAMAALPALVSVLVFGLLRRWASRLPWLVPIAARLRFEAWTRADPRGFAAGLALASWVVSELGIGALGFRWANESFHRPDLAGLALGAWVAAGGLLAFVGAAVLHAGIRTVAERLGRFASIGTLIGLAVTVLGVASVVVPRLYPDILFAYGWSTLLAPISIAGLVLFSVVGASYLSRRIGKARRTRAAAIVVFTCVASLVVTAASYDRNQRVRLSLEQRTVAGGRLLRLWSRLTDRDRDGFSFAFGGGDCDDSNPNIYPGAPDAPGDSVDADCFEGDGSRTIAGLDGDGQYSARTPIARPKFLVITIDALRGDAFVPANAPRMTSLMNEGTVFTTAVAPASRSIRSIPGMWTGLFPSQIAYGAEFLFPTLDPSNTTVAEVLTGAGYETSAVIGTNYFSRTHEFLQGFGHRFHDPTYQMHPRVTAEHGLAELRRLEDTGRPWFLWVHFFNVHQPHPSAGPNMPIADSYVHEVQSADEQAMRLVDELRARGTLDSVVVVIASDHGEALGEHDVVGHSTTLFEPELLATLAIRVPGVAPHRTAVPVSLVDLAPTMLNLAQLPMPVPSGARSLLPFMLGERALDPERWLVSELLPDGYYPWDIKALRRGDYKLIWWVREGTRQLFDLSTDPGEQNDLTDERPELASTMLGTLRAWVSAKARPEAQRRHVLAENVLSEAPPIQHRTDIVVPGVGRLLGYDLPRSRYHRGETIPLVLYWQATDDTDRDLFVNLGTRGIPGAPGMHGAHFPVYAQYHTTEWRPGEIIRDPVMIVVPPEMPFVTVRFDFSISENNFLVPILENGAQTDLLWLFELQIVPDGQR
jgi:arylsulfatase A-like enzyme